MRKKKKVAQYDLNGKHIATYVSISEASRKTGVALVAIANCIRGEATIGGKHTICRRAGQFMWRDASKYTPNKIKPYSHPLNKKTAQYDLNGHLINVFESRKKAANESHITNIHLENCTNGTYQWKDAETHSIRKQIKQHKNIGKLKFDRPIVRKDRSSREILQIYQNVKDVGLLPSQEINISFASSTSSVFINNKWGVIPYKPKPEQWIILQYTIDGLFVKEYPHLIDIVKMMNCSRGKLAYAVNGKSTKNPHLAFGYLWYRKKDLNNTIIENLFSNGT